MTIYKPIIDPHADTEAAEVFYIRIEPARPVVVRRLVPMPVRKPADGRTLRDILEEDLNRAD